MHSLKLVLYIFLFASSVRLISSRSLCEIYDRHLKYYKVRDCYKSNIPVISWTRTSNLQDCMEFTRQRNGLAFNFSPEEASNYRNFSQNCHVLGCPETKNGITLVADLTFDYYSAYGNLSMTENSTCIKSIGLFGLIEEKHNYNRSTEKCQNIGAHLANVLSEIRTNHLSQYINDTLQDWYKVAYIGLNDINEEGNFRTLNGSKLSCFRYRAWGPGHPRSKHRNEDCVVLDSDRMWRVVKCSSKLPALCEFYPSQPLENVDFGNISYHGNSSNGQNGTCISKQITKDLNLTIFRREYLRN
ncbi:uncharacterized protein LOC108910878 [Anoplophora glabripennis]|uniref:uncharacterized protein LOC108910878 n=1 Tax=Anoplophora glabripennis TaxID=217634 RepID=UPI00087549EA|nr:uncharacterized protein LOC108910878 [Anoplophora glabripennis]